MGPADGRRDYHRPHGGQDAHDGLDRVAGCEGGAASYVDLIPPLVSKREGPPRRTRWTQLTTPAVWVASIILGRDVGLAISALYYRYISLPAPKTFARYWDFSLPSAEVKPTTVSKYNTALQLALVGLTAAAPVLPLDLSSPLSALQ